MKKNASFAVIMIFLMLIPLSLASSLKPVAAADSKRIYDSIPAKLPPNVPSWGYECCQTSEFGDNVGFAAGTDRLLTTVTVTLSDWAKHSTYPSMPSSGWTYPITLNLYAVDHSGPNPALGSKFATLTRTFAIPWRPEADSRCVHDDAWYVDGVCYHGIAFSVVFDFTGMNVVLPNEIVYGIAYNTADYGYSPLHSNGPYNSLNVALRDYTKFGAPSVGTDVEPDALFLNSAGYGYNIPTPVNVFRRDSGWSPYTPAVRFSATQLPESCPADPPDKSKEVINVEYKVVNSEDASMGPWYWALDSMTLHIKVWQLPDGSWFALKTYDGKFAVPKGAHSPVAGTLETKAGSGDWKACYTVSFTGTLAPTTFADGSPLKTHGNLGVSDERGTVADIVASYPSGSVSANPGYWSWLSHFFPVHSNVVYHYDQWMYNLHDDQGATADELIEVGIYSGTPTAIGDIIT